MCLKKRYLFPIVYVALAALSLMTTREGIMILIAPQALMMLGVEMALGIQIFESVYLLIFLGAIQFFILGYLFDVAAEWFKNDKDLNQK